MSIDAGAGLDLLVYAGSSSSYTIDAVAGGYTIQSSAFTDSLVNVERLAFDNVRVALDINGNAGMAYRLYQAAFDRAPDLPGLGFQMSALDNGWALWQIAQNFIDSPEFSSKYGAVSDAQFVTLLYQNVLDRAPDQAGFDFHLNHLQTTHTRADVLREFSESPENQANVIGAIENGMQYLI
jgi:serralysin